MASKELPAPNVLRQLLRYEPETGKLFWKPRSRDHFKTNRSHATWNARYAGAEAFTAFDGHGYRTGAVNYRQLKAHQVIWAMEKGEWPSFIDHINGKRADNRIGNLRDVSRADNQRNHKMHVTNSSGQMGVCWHERAGKWCAYIDNGRRFHLGLFEALEDAIAARRKAEKDIGFHENHGKRTA